MGELVIITSEQPEQMGTVLGKLRWTVAIQMSCFYLNTVEKTAVEMFK